jgi:hypothetical protein
MLEVANVEHALFTMLSQSYSLRRFPATDPSFGPAGVGHSNVAQVVRVLGTLIRPAFFMGRSAIREMHRPSHSGPGLA